MRLYLCDDNPEYRTLARLMLERAGHAIVGEAADGGEAIEHAARTEPDVLVLDLNMPRVTGLQALPELRRRLPDSKIVVLTTGGNNAERDQALAAGADGFIVKPESVFDLAGLLDQALAGPPRAG